MIKLSRSFGGRLLIVCNYYLAAILLLIAGFFKLLTPEISELLQTLYEQKILNFYTIITISHIHPWLEILLAAIALSGWQFQWFARIMALLYLAFTVLIATATQGYLLLPIDCGCFGNGDGTPAYLLILRNSLISILLLFMGQSLKSWTIWGRIFGIQHKTI